MRFSPFNVYRTRDGWVAIGTATAAEWLALLRAMGQSELPTSRPELLETSWRISNNGEVDALIDAWLHDLIARRSPRPCWSDRRPLQSGALDRRRTRLGSVARPRNDCPAHEPHFWRNGSGGRPRISDKFSHTPAFPTRCRHRYRVRTPMPSWRSAPD